MAKSAKLSEYQQPWELCHYCPLQSFKQSSDFTRHLRDRHCTIEGGSFVCRYGYNGVCASLPLDGVSDRDYESHVIRYHVQQTSRGPEQWSVFSAAQNLPAVLNDPSRGKQLNLFTKKWGDAFVEKVPMPQSPYLVDITYDHIKPFIAKIGRRYRRHVRLIKNVSPAVLLAQQEQQQQQQQSDQLRLTIKPITANDRNDISINDIPKIFTQPMLNLTNPQVFTEVFPGICYEKREYDAGRLLQDKLSYYLDIVEDQIAKQVSQKSAAFFHAMTSQDAIMDDMNAATENVRNLRAKLRKLDESIVRKSLMILSMERIRSSKHFILEKLKLMATVHQTQPMIQLLLGTQDYVAALDLISTTQEIIAQELIGIVCFKHLPLQLNEMEEFIDKMMAADFEKYASADLNRPLNDAQTAEGVLEQDKLIAIISGLLRKRNYSFIDTYQEEAIDTVKALIKQIMIEIIATGESETCLTGAGEEAQTLSISEWITVLDRATVNLLRLLQRVRSVYDVMKQICDEISGKCDKINENHTLELDVFFSEPEYYRVSNKLHEMINSICNYCHERCANLVSTQSLEDTIISAEQLQKLSQIVNDFSDGCEKIVGIQSVPLQVALKIQGNKYAQKFHSDRKSKLALLLDSERWKQADVPVEFQRMVDRAVRGVFTLYDRDDITVSPSKVLYIDAEPFVLVGAALILVQIICEYCCCATELNIISIQLSRYVIDLLRTFNSRCCQLVLGAGALRVAGLTTITSANLALVSRALQFVVWLLPQVKSHFQKFESPTSNSINAGYETIEKDFNSHIAEIENKVISIVCTLVDKQLTLWNARPPVPSQAFRNISRHLFKLHEAIAPILPEQQVNKIYKIMHQNFKDKLRLLLVKFNIVNNGGPQHGIVTSELTFYVETLRTLNVVAAKELIDESMDDVWQK